MRKLKRIKEVDVAHQIEALRFSLYFVEAAFNRLKKFCDTWENKESPTHLPFETAATVLNDCWTIVDQSDRAREITESIKGFRNKTDEKRKFLKAVSQSRDMRNLYHHFGRKATSLPEKSSLIIGSLSWVSKSDKHAVNILSLNSGSVESSHPSIVFDRLNSRFVTDFQFAVADEQVWVGDIARACKEFAAFINRIFSDNDLFEEGEIEALAIRASFTFLPQEDTEDPKRKAEKTGASEVLRE